MRRFKIVIVLFVAVVMLIFGMWSLLSIDYNEFSRSGSSKIVSGCSFMMLAGILAPLGVIYVLLGRK